MFRLDTIRLIRKTVKRFLSLTLIVLIGVAFMMGLMSNPLLMRKSVDVYDDEYRLHDIQIYSQYGFCLRDYIKLQKSENVKDIFASKMIDVEGTIWNSSPFVVRVSELDRKVDKLKLVSGRLPEQANECVVLENIVDGNYRIGDHIILSYGDQDINDYLRFYDYMIVGEVETVEYTAKITETSNYKNKELGMVIYIPNQNFISDYYTTIYMTIDGADQLLSYTDEYKDYIDDRKTDIESIAFVEQDYLKGEIQQKAEEELAEAKEEFEQKKQEGQEELQKAAEELNSANIKITTYESEIEGLQMMISRLEATVDAHQDDITSANQELMEFFDKYDLDPAMFYMQEVKDYAEASLAEAKEEYEKLTYMVASARKQYDEGLEEYKEALLTFNEEIEKADIEIRKAEQEIADLPNAKWTILDRDSQYSSYMYDGSCTQMQAIGYAMPVMFFLVAALVCLTTMKRLVDEQRGQIGIFVALGFSNRQI
ncbi:MAG: hypothetical protein J5796_04755, partial [Erysipelotrichaceae bacterium]|nr:hypothetical protein [Erysipelotrichaceae bacterium]